ncbi:hypothetical protein ICW40_04170 [Actinotalea ferrariae]|uniref:hypothetical protein n=1 Tax=Actinotalea ferrariae TaxID=1386098 RepID=UPI001C8B200F|nr:hypothetical protein [Actinotalea ferrariae]MBX9244003.1 hypothetical protein [Actinotalea ferrariae]
MKAPRMSGSTRTIWIMALTAVISLAAGLGLSRLIVSPADAAANAAPPAAGPITVPVETKALANDVVLRGDAVYEDPADVVVETADIGGPAVVTGHVPEVGATLEAGAVALEVAGRPVIVLPGELPVYRTLRVGVSGPDVLQLKAALVALGLNPGDAASSSYDAATAAAVEALYSRVGYEAPTAGEDADEMVSSARDGVRAAEEQVGSAQRALSAARKGLPQSERISLDTEVTAAQLALEQERGRCAAPPNPETGETSCNPVELARAEGAYNGAVAARAERLAAPETAEEQAALASAQRALEDARDQLADAQEDVITPLPASEVVYLAGLPRRVDAVPVKRGASVSGTPVMSVSGATLQIAGMVSAEDAALVTAGAPVTIAMPDGTEAPGTVQSVGAPDEETPGSGDGGSGDGGGSGSGAGAEGRMRVVVVPDALTEEQRAQLQGANVRLTIPVSATEGEVLAVPTAALTAGPGGEARVEVLDADGESTLVTVETGLAADGFVEVTAVDGTLAEGDRVVVGVTGGGADEDAEDEASDEESSDESADS